MNSNQKGPKVERGRATELDVAEISAVTDVRVNNDDTELRTRSRATASGGREGHGTTRNQHHKDKKNILFQRERWDRLQRGGLRQLAFPSLPPTPRNATQRIAKSTWAWASHQSTPQQQWTPPSAASVPTSSARRRPPGATASPSTPQRPSTSTVRRSNYLRFPSSVCQFRSAPPPAVSFAASRSQLPVNDPLQHGVFALFTSYY